MAKEMKKRPTGRTVEKKTRLIMAGFTPRATAAAAVHPNVCPYIVLEIKPCGLGSRIRDVEADLIY